MEIERYFNFSELERFSSGESTRAYELLGCRYIAGEDAHLFAVWAPHAERVSVTGDFCGWDENALPMKRFGGGVWGVMVQGCRKGQVYKFAVTSRGVTTLKSDPYALHCETGPATGSKVWDIDGVEWHDGEWLAKRDRQDILRSPVSIYEVHLGSWKKRPEEVYPNYREIAKKLAEYCVDMHYTHVELLPITEYPYEGSWGYQVTGYYAPTSRYGTPEDFAFFVDTMHRAGIGVIIDWVPAHFPRDAHGLAYFDGQACYERRDSAMASHPQWGTLIFDYEQPEVRSFLISSACFFARKYHIDGIRVDAVTSMLYLNYARDEYTPNREGGNIDLGAVSFLRSLNTALHRLGIISIAEESSDYPLVSGAPENGGLGFTFKWDMGFMHDTLDYFSLDPLFRKGSHNKLTFSMMYAYNERYILAYSHDEVVHGKKSMLNKMFGSYDEKFSTLRALYGYQFAHPGKKLTFMGSEIGQFIEWDYKREIDWFLLSYPRHDEMRRYMRILNGLYLEHPALWDNDISWDGFHWLNVDDADRSSVAFMRISRDGERVLCACNFTPKQWQLRVALPTAGKLRLILNSDEPNLGGSGGDVKKTVTARARPFRDSPYSAMLSLPPLSAVYYEFRES